MSDIEHLEKQGTVTRVRVQPGSYLVDGITMQFDEPMILKYDEATGVFETEKPS